MHRALGKATITPAENRDSKHSQSSALRFRALTIAALSLVILWVCGCSTPQTNPYFANSEPPTVFPEGGSAPPTPAPAPAPVVTPPEPAPEMVAIAEIAAPVLGLDILDTNPPPATNVLQPTVAEPPKAAAPTAQAASSRWGTGWVSFQRFANECGSGTPQRQVSGNTSRYLIATRNGSLMLTIGSKLARINGLNVWLGFAPQVIHGEPYLHALDAEKTLQPLAEHSTLSTGTRTIVLDPGHGGTDSGTRGARGEREKDFTLDWAVRVEQLLTNAGWRVVLTRRNDIDVPLPERVAIAERARADLFISLHFNSAAPHVGPSGIETYCLTPAGMLSTLARGYSDDTRVAFPNNVFDRANVQLAARLHRELIAETRAADDGIKRARFMGVLRTQNRPAVLIEGGYLSNPGEMTQISNARYRQRLAEAVVRALK
jgi:N-acetylmuramoyl-L-alanine amidase